MRISTRGRYALRMMVYLGALKSGQTASLKEISTSIHVKPKYLEQIASTLTKAGLVRVTRGSGGGYCLSRSPSEYSALEMLSAVEGRLAPVACLETEDNLCEYADQCATLPFWREMDSVINTFLQSRTLQDIIDGRER